MAGDGERRSRRPTDRSSVGCWPRSRPPRRPGETCAASSRRRSSSSRPRASRGGRRSSCGSRTLPSRSRELRRLLDLHDAYEIADRADSLAGEGRHDEAAELYREAAAAAPAERRARLLGRARNRRVRRPRRGRRRVREAIDGRPGWLASPALAARARDRAVGGGRPRGARGPEGSLRYEAGRALGAPGPLPGTISRWRQTPRGCGPWPRWSSSISLGTSHRPETPKTT